MRFVRKDDVLSLCKSEERRLSGQNESYLSKGAYVEAGRIFEAVEYLDDYRLVKCADCKYRQKGGNGYYCLLAPESRFGQENDGFCSSGVPIAMPDQDDPWE